MLKGKNAYEFEQQLEKLDSFINKNWGFDIDDNGRTAYVRPCLINIYREDCKELIEKNIPKTYKKNEYDFILASQAYRSRSLTKSKIAEPMLKNKLIAEGIAKAHPMKRIGEGKDAAAMAKFLLTDESSWITGQIIGVDGGRSKLT